MAIKMALSGNKEFEAACKVADIPPTRRQWKKWQDRRGLAFDEWNNMSKEDREKALSVK